MKYILITILLVFSFNLSAQDVASTEQVRTGVAKTTQMKIVAPSLWQQCDYYEGYSSFCVYKSSVDGNLYLIGFDENAEQILKHKIDDAEFNTQMTICYVTYNGWTIRLYNKLQ